MSWNPRQTNRRMGLDFEDPSLERRNKASGRDRTVEVQGDDRRLGCDEMR